jgi:hypothetical protein
MRVNAGAFGCKLCERSFVMSRAYVDLGQVDRMIFFSELPCHAGSVTYELDVAHDGPPHTNDCRIFERLVGQLLFVYT